MTTFEVEPTHRRAWGEEQLEALFAEGFPPFITADLAVKPWIGRVREFFPHLDIVLIDDGQPVATGWGVPIAWDGRPEDLPESFAGILRRAVALHEAGATGDTFVICGGVVHPARKATGAASALVEALRDTGTGSGLVRVLAPVRPTRKHLPGNHSKAIPPPSTVLRLSGIATVAGATRRGPALLPAVKPGIRSKVAVGTGHLAAVVRLCGTSSAA